MPAIEIGIAEGVSIAFVVVLIIGIGLGVKVVEWLDRRYKTRK